MRHYHLVRTAGLVDRNVLPSLEGAANHPAAWRRL